MSKPASQKNFPVRGLMVLFAVAAGALILVPSGVRENAQRKSVEALVASPMLSARAATEQSSRVRASLEALPLAFEANRGQTDPQVKYLARGQGYTLFLTSTDAVFSFHSPRSSDVGRRMIQRPVRPHPENQGQQHGTRNDQDSVVHMRLVGGSSQALVEASDPLPGKVNYFVGNDPNKWRTDVPLYARVFSREVYPGVNMAFHGGQRQLEFDFIVAPGADAAPIALGFSGARSITTDAGGNLRIASSGGDLTLHKPVAYQEEHGTRQLVDARFVLQAHDQVGLQLGSYDRGRELVIDPVVYVPEYATFLGGSKEDDVFGIAVDGTGNAFVVGATQSSDFPPSGSTTLHGFDVFISKLSPTGGLSFTTFLGGNKDDFPASIALDGSGIYIAGTTQSTNFPVPNGAQPKFPTKITTTPPVTPDTGFAAKLTLTGNTISWATYLGGNNVDTVSALAVDSAQSVYVVGTTLSTNFAGGGVVLPLPSGASLNLGKNTTNTDGFIARLKSDGTQFLLVSYLGGSNVDTALGVAVNPVTGNVYVTGSTTSADLPTNLTPGVFQPGCGTDGACNNGGGAANTDAYVAAIDPTNSTFIYLTYLGGELSDAGFGIAVDSTGAVYVTGKTNSTQFPKSSNPLQATLGGAQNAFVTKLKPDGTGPLVYSTYLGGNGSDAANAITLDSSLNAYLTGSTTSSNFPLQGATQTTYGGGSAGGTGDAFVTELNPAGGGPLFSTYLGGSGDEDIVGGSGAIAVDSLQNIYVAGDTTSVDFPSVNAVDGSLNNAASPQPTCKINGGKTSVTCPDGFVVKYAQNLVDFGISASPLNPAAMQAGASATSTITVSSAGGFSGTVGLACSSALPTGVSCMFSSTSVAGGQGTSTLTVATTSSTPVGIHPITIQGTSATGSHTTEITLNVLAGFTLSATALTPASVNAGGSSTSTVTLTPGPGYSGTANLTCSVTGTGAPAPSCSTGFSPKSVSGTSPTSTLTVTTIAPNAMLTPASPRSGVWYALLLPIGGIALLGAGLGPSGPRRKKLFDFVVLGTLLIGLLGLPGCVSSTKGKPLGTGSGTYTITVTGTDSKNPAVVSSAPVLTLTVN